MRQLFASQLRSVLLTFMWGLLACGCRAALEPQCTRRPASGADFGTCAAIIGAYYDASRDTCVPASGCECDAACREQVPFTTVEECQTACESGKAPNR